MIRSICLGTLLLLTPTIQADDEPEMILETAKQKASYGIGLNIGRQMASQGLEIDTKALAAGIADMLASKEPRISQADLQAAMAAFQEELAARAKAMAAENGKKATAFLAENAKKEGVKQTKSGLQYKILIEGEGKMPTVENTVSAHYRGKLLNGTVFDESYKGEKPTVVDEPTSFPLNRVIAGWTEALQLMKPGTSCRLFIPPALAYGEAGRPGIPPNSLLIFDIELVNVK
ncbi:MAG: FKBP-type peptidyl-prolyl cis-trans isomerase [Fuerstiella sp.]